MKIEHLGEYGEHAIAKAGLRKGDVIVGSRQRPPDDRVAALRVYPAPETAGRSRAVTVLRDGDRKTLSYVLP